MKAVILAGGKATRGRPYTDYFPKAMIPINGRPLIDYIAGYLRSFDFIEEIIVISDFEGLGGQIKNYYKGGRDGMVFFQDSQSGTAGDLVPLEERLKGQTKFVLWFVDNLCAVDLEGMHTTYREKDSMACIATRTKRKEETGFARVEDSVIKEFMEKPVMELQMAECLGVYILAADIVGQIKAKQGRKKDLNLSYDILQQLSKEGKVSAHNIGDRQWIDAESPTVLERNKDMVCRIIAEMES